MDGKSAHGGSDKSFEEKLAASSIGQGLAEIEELGIDHHLLHLDEEMKDEKDRQPCPKCGKQL